MPIRVLCPSCSSTVNAPDSAAGKRAKCPKCQAVMLLPEAEPAEEEFDVVDEPVPPKRSRGDEDDRPVKKTKSSRKIVVEEEDEDEDDIRPKKKSRRREDDDEDDRPRKKGQKKKAGPPLGLLIGGGVALLLLLAGGTYFLFFTGGDANPANPKEREVAKAKAINWVPFSAPDGSYSTAFPEGAPTEETLESLARQSGNKNANPEDVKRGMEMMKAIGVVMTGWSRTHENHKYLVMVISVPPAMAKQMTPDAIMKQGQQQGSDKIMAESDFSFGGLEGKEVLSRDQNRNVWQLLRFGSATPGKIVVLMVETEAELKADNANAKAFFEKFQWKK